MESLAIVILTVLVIVMFFYIIFLRTQIQRISRILEKRLRQKSDQIITVELLDSQINKLAVNVNKALVSEEKLRIKVVQEERNFKDLIANISHDLRTPLTSIRGYLQLLSKSDLDQEQQLKLSIARKHTDELGDLIEHFFEYAYLLDTTVKANPVNMNLTNMVTECVAAVYPQIEQKGLKLELDDKQVMIYSDKEMTRRMIQNLLRNCLVHAQDRIILKFSENVIYDETTGKNMNQIILHVKNPISNDAALDVDRIFERFYVGDKARTTTGLGLSIVKMLAEQNGGEVKATRKNGILDIMLIFYK